MGTFLYRPRARVQGVELNVAGARGVFTVPPDPIGNGETAYSSMIIQFLDAPVDRVILQGGTGTQTDQNHAYTMTPDLQTGTLWGDNLGEFSVMDLTPLQLAIGAVIILDYDVTRTGGSISITVRNRTLTPAISVTSGPVQTLALGVKTIGGVPTYATSAPYARILRMQLGQPPGGIVYPINEGSGNISDPVGGGPNTIEWSGHTWPSSNWQTKSRVAGLGAQGTVFRGTNYADRIG
jgi:hypothetical protein